MIVEEPSRTWTHRRLLEMDWVWSQIHDPTRADLYRKAVTFVQYLIATQNNAGQQANEGAALIGETFGWDNKNLQETEADLGDGQTTTMTGEDSVPGFFRDAYNPCRDPSWTWKFLALFDEFDDFTNSPCEGLYDIAL